MAIPTQVKYSGVVFEFGNEQIIVPPLTTGLVEKNVRELQIYDNIAIKDSNEIFQKAKAAYPFVLAAIRRNYTIEEFPEAMMDDFVTMRNVLYLVAAAMGLDHKSSQVKKVGEVVPVA